MFWWIMFNQLKIQICLKDKTHDPIATTMREKNKKRGRFMQIKKSIEALPRHANQSIRQNPIAQSNQP